MSVPAAPSAQAKDKEKASPLSAVKQYGGAMLAVAPVSLAKDILGIPMKTNEGVVETRLKHVIQGAKKVPLVPAYKAGLRRAAFSSLTKVPIGIITFPAYTKAVSLMSSDDKEDRRKGALMLLGSGAAYQGIKGIGEAAGELKRGGASRRVMGKVLKASGSKFLGAASVVLPSTYLISKGIADQRRKDRQSGATTEQRGLLSGALKPALTAGGVGAAAGAVEAVVSHLGDLPPTRRQGALQRLVGTKGLKVIGPKALAYGGAGLAGGVVGKLVVDRAISKLKSKEQGGS